MRTQTFISSMVGVAAAVAVAGSANAAIPTTGVSVFDFTTQVTSHSSGSVNGSNPFITWETDAGYKSTATSANAQGGAITLACGGAKAGGTPTLDFGVFTATDPITENFVSFVNLTGMTALELNVTAYTPYTSGAYTAPSLVMNVIMFDDSLYEGAGGQLIIDGTGKKSATITASEFFNWSKVTLIEIQGNSFTLPSSGAGRSDANYYASYSFTFNSMVAVPAPGAAALVGLAGLVATRRRRN